MRMREIGIGVTYGSEMERRGKERREGLDQNPLSPKSKIWGNSDLGRSVFNRLGAGARRNSLNRATLRVVRQGRDLDPAYRAGSLSGNGIHADVCGREVRSWQLDQK